MKVIKLSNDLSFQRMLKEEPEKKETVKQYDNNPAAGTQEPERVEREPQADTQEPAEGEAKKEKKEKGKKAQK